MQAKELVQLIKSKKSPTIIDVRSGFEYHSGHIPGAIHAPAWRILFKIATIPKDKEVKLVVLCEHGPRAQMAQGLLGIFGYRNVTLLDGHMAEWRRAGLTVEK